MTKIIKINAIVAPVLLIIATLFKTSHWPGANVLMILGLAASILLFVLLITSGIGKHSSGYVKFTGIFASLTIIITLVAFLFKLLHLQGAAILIWVADIGILLSGVLLLIDGLTEKDPAKWILKVIAAYFIFLFVLLLVFLQ